MSATNLVPLKELCESVIDCPHSSPVWKESGIPVVRNYNLVNGHIDMSNLSYVDEETYKKRTQRAVPEYQDIVISREAPMGVVAIIPKHFKCCMGQRLVLLKVNKKICNPEYLLYALMSEYVQFQIRNVDRTGSIVSNLNIPDLENLIIPVVPKPEQKAIASCIGRLDDKISNNAAISSQLESLANTIYDYWFLQFDFPDENGRPYKSSGGKMVWNEELKREIPEKWAVKKLPDIVRWEGGAQPPKSTFVYCEQPGYVRFIQNRDYADNSHKTYIRKSNNNKLCNEYDIMMDKYGDAGAIRFGIAGAYNVALAKIDVQLKNGQEYVRSFLKSEAVYNYLHQACVASTRASLNGDNLSSVYIPIPSQQILFEFEKIIKKDIFQILLLKSENQQLSSLRDFLLPMLMNGQVTFKEDA